MKKPYENKFISMPLLPVGVYISLSLEFMFTLATFENHLWKYSCNFILTTIRKLVSSIPIWVSDDE